MAAVELRLADEDVRRIAAAVAEQLQKPSEALLTVSQVSSLTGLSSKALERRRSRGVAPHAVKRGGRVRYLRSEVERYVAGGGDA